MIHYHHNHCNTQQQQWKAVRHERAAGDLCDGNGATFPTVEYSHEYFRPLLFSHRKHRISQLQDYTSTMIFSRISWVNILSNILIVALAVKHGDDNLFKICTRNPRWWVGDGLKSSEVVRNIFTQFLLKWGFPKAKFNRCWMPTTLGLVGKSERGHQNLGYQGFREGWTWLLWMRWKGFQKTKWILSMFLFFLRPILRLLSIKRWSHVRQDWGILGVTKWWGMG